MTSTPLHRPAGSLARDGDPHVLGPDEAGWTYSGLRVLHLADGERRTLDLDGVEACVVPMGGGGDVTVETVGGPLRLRGRTSVFAAIPDVAFVGLAQGCTLVADGPAEVAVATSLAEQERASFLQPAERVDVASKGAGQATRQITGLLSADVDGPQRLIVVEVLTPAGNWSSYPPHKHDELTDDEVPLEEVYHFRIDGQDGFGLHRTYTTDGEIDATVAVRDGDTFLVPRGWHGPCVAAPGYDMYYLNVMAGPDPERRWLVCNDPAHDWVVTTWPDLPTDPRVPMTGPVGGEG